MFPPSDPTYGPWWPWLTRYARHAGGGSDDAPCWDRMCPQWWSEGCLATCPHGHAGGTWRYPQLAAVADYGATTRGGEVVDGWVEICRPDRRRGLWYRAFPVRGNPSTIELRSGREGGDGFVSLHAGLTLGEREMLALEGCLTDAVFAHECAEHDAARGAGIHRLSHPLRSPGPRRARQARVIHGIRPVAPLGRQPYPAS